MKKKNKIVPLILAGAMLAQVGCAAAPAEAEEIIVEPSAVVGLQNSDWCGEEVWESAQSYTYLSACPLGETEQKLAYEDAARWGVEYTLLLAVAAEGRGDFPYLASELDYMAQSLADLLGKHGVNSMALMVYDQGEEEAVALWEQGVYSTDYTKRVLEIKAQYDEEVRNG